MLYKSIRMRVDDAVIVRRCRCERERNQNSENLLFIYSTFISVSIHLISPHIKLILFVCLRIRWRTEKPAATSNRIQWDNRS